MAAAEDTGLLTQHLNDLIHHVILVILIGIVIGQVRVFATEEPDTQHDGCRTRKVVRPGLAGASHADPSSVMSRRVPTRARKGVDMPNSDEGSSPGPTPTWALQQATEELYEVEDTKVIAQRAREIAGEAQGREDERHDEYDDPDQGGEG